MATFNKVILSGQPFSYPTLVNTPILTTTVGSVTAAQAPNASAITATITNATTTGSVITYTATNTFVAGQVVTITGITGFTNANLTNAVIASATGANFTVVSAVATQTYTASGTATVAVSNTTATVSAAAMTINTNILTYTTSAAHGFIVGQVLTITGLSGTNAALANLANVVIATVPSTTTFTVQVAYSTLAVALTTQTGTATSFNALFSYTSAVNAQVFAATQLVSVTGLTTNGYNVGSAPILSVATLSAPSASLFAFGFTVSVPSTVTGTLSAQAGTATALPLTGTLIHNNLGTGLDEVWLYATNLTASTVTLALSFGAPQLGTTPFTPEMMNITIPGNSGLTLITPGLILNNNTASAANSAVYAYASAANAIAISGYVNRIA
jgi:hypothetical protein